MVEIEALRSAEMINSDVTLRLLQPEDHSGYLEVVASAWGKLEGLQEHDFLAKATMGNLVGAFDDQGRLVGFSDNVLSAYTNEVMIHMIATREEYHDRGIGTDLMRYNITLITRNILPDRYQELMLTSDPLESRNVRYYLRKTGFVSSEYKPAAYKKVTDGASTTHAGLPQDRFIYRLRPRSQWASNRKLPTAAAYLELLNSVPVIEKDSAVVSDDSVQFVETPYDLQTLKADNLELANEWRQWQGACLIQLFDNKYTAVDQFLTPEGQSFIVVCKEFNHDDPDSLIKHL